MVLNLIAQQLETMVEAAEKYSIRRKCKAVTALFSYAVWRYRDGQREQLGILFRLFKAMVPWVHCGAWGLFRVDRSVFMWCRVEPLVATLLDEGGPDSLKHAIVLASPYLPWRQFNNHDHLIKLWAAVAVTVPFTSGIGQSVVDTLFQLADDPSLQPHIPVGMWSWLAKHPSLPPVCLGRFHGSTGRVVRVVRAFGDIEILKSYLLLIWSEWDEPRRNGLHEMCALLREDFSRTGMGYYRQDLLRQLNYVLERLDLGPEHLRPRLETHDILRMKEQYGKLREVLLEVDREATVTLIREPPVLIVPFSPLTTADRYRMSLDFYVCTPSSVSVVACLDRSSLLLPTPNSQGGRCRSYSWS